MGWASRESKSCSDRAEAAGLVDVSIGVLTTPPLRARPGTLRLPAPDRKGGPPREHCAPSRSRRGGSSCSVRIAMASCCTMAGLDNDPAIVLASNLRHFRVRFDRGDERPTRHQHAVDLARHDEPGEAALQGHDEDIGRGKRFVQARLRLIGEESHIGQSPALDLLLKKSLFARLRRRSRSRRPGRSATSVGDIEQGIDVLRHADVA